MADSNENPFTATPESTRVIVSTYVCMSATIIVLGARAICSTLWKRKFGLDDLFLLLALATGIAQSACMEHAAKRGLGTFIRPGNAALTKRMSELVYASDLFFLVAILFAKLAVVRLVYRVSSASALAKGRIMILQVSVLVWAAFAIPAIAFQCSSSLPWLYIPDRCVGQGALWYPTLIINIFTDIWLAFCVWSTVPELQIRPQQRQIVLGLFGSRALVCIFGVVQLALLAPALHNINQARALPNPSVLKQFVMNSSIICAALPVLYRSLGAYVAQPVAAPSMCAHESDKQQTPLEDITYPEAAAKKQPYVTEVDSETKDVPKSNDTDFSSSLSLAFNKEIEASSRV